MTPEAELVVAVIEQAVRDLSDPDATIRKDANSFFFAGGAWAEMRSFYCHAVGVDPETVQEQIRRAGKAGEPARQRRGVLHPFSLDDLRALIPAETAFQTADLPFPEHVTPTVRALRFQALVKDGFIESVGYRWYARTSLHHPRMLTGREKVLSVLEHDPMTVKEIAMCFRPRLPLSTVHADCDTLANAGLADKVGPATYRLRRADQIAA